MSIYYNSYSEPCLGPVPFEIKCFAPLIGESIYRLNALMDERVGQSLITKKELVSFLHFILKQQGYYELYLVGGSAERSIVGLSVKGDFDLAIFNSIINFQQFVDHIIPFLVAKGVSNAEIRVNYKHNLISFGDVDIKFPTLDKPTHLFDADALAILLNPRSVATLIPGAKLPRSPESLRYVIDCNVNKRLNLTNPEQAEGFGYRALSKITHGWTFEPILLEQSLNSLMAQFETRDQFDRSLRLFLLGHTQVNEELFLMNIHSLLQKKGVHDAYLSVVVQLMRERTQLDLFNERDSLFLGALQANTPFVESLGYFCFDDKSFFISGTFYDMVLCILKNGQLSESDFFDLLQFWVRAKTKEESASRRTILNNLFLSRGLDEHECFKGRLATFLQDMKEAEAFEIFKQSTLEYQITLILKKKGATKKEWEILLHSLKKNIDQISFKDLILLHKILMETEGKNPFQDRLLERLLCRENFPLATLLEHLKQLNAEYFSDLALNAVCKHPLWASRFKDYFHQDLDHKPIKIEFWQKAFLKEEIHPFLELDVKKTYWFSLETYLDYVENKPIPMAYKVLLDFCEDHVLKALTGLKIERFAHNKNRLISVFYYLFEKDFEVGHVSETTTLGGLCQKVRDIHFFVDSDLSRLKNELKTFPKELQSIVLPVLQQKIFSEPAKSLEFFMVGSKGVLEDGRYFEFLKKNYPAGLEQGYMTFPFDQDLKISETFYANTDYLNFLRSNLPNIEKESVRERIRERLVTLETFENDFDEEILFRAFLRGRLTPEQIFKHYQSLKKGLIGQACQYDLFSPIFESDIWTKFPHEDAVFLASFTPTLSHKDLETRVDFLLKDQQTAQARRLISSSIKKGHFIDEKRLIFIENLFENNKDWLSCFNWDYLISQKKELDRSLILRLFSLVDCLTDKQLDYLVKYFVKQLGNLSKKEMDPLILFLDRLKDQKSFLENIVLSLLQNTGLITEMDPRLFRYFEEIISTIKTKKHLYEPLRFQLLVQRPQDSLLECISSKELIELMKLDHSLVNPLLLFRIIKGRLEVNKIADLIKQSQCSKEILTALIESSQAYKLSFDLKKDLFILGAKNGVFIELMGEDWGFASHITWEDYKMNKDAVDLLLQNHPQIQEIYLKFVLFAFERQDFDRTIFPNLCLMLPSYPLEVSHAKILMDKAKEATVIPTSYLLLLLRMGFHFEEHLITLQTLHLLIKIPNFETHVSSNFWNIQSKTNQAQSLGICQTSECLETQIIKSHNLRSICWAMEEAKEKGQQAPGVQSAKEIIQFFWKKDFYHGIDQFQVADYIDLFAPDSIEVAFVDLTREIQFFIDKGENLKKEDLDRKNALDLLLQDFLKKNQIECRLEMTFKIWDMLQRLASVPFKNDQISNPLMKELNDFLLMKLGAVKFLALQTSGALHKLSLENHSVASNLSNKFLDYLENIIMQILPGLQHVGSFCGGIKHLIEEPALPLFQPSKNMVNLQILLHLSYRFFKDQSKEENDALMLRSLIPPLVKGLKEAFERKEYDRKNFAELHFIITNMPEYTHFIQKDELKIFIDLALVLMEVTIREDLEHLKTEIAEFWSIFKDTVIILEPGYGFNDGDETKRKWIQTLLKIAPDDPSLVAMQQHLAPRGMEYTLLDAINLPSFERLLIENLLTVPIELRMTIFLSFIEKFQSRLTYNEEDFTMKKVQSNMLVLNTIGRKLRSDEFLELLGLNVSENSVQKQMLYQTYFELIFKNEHAIEVSQGSSSILYELSLLMDQYLLFLDPSFDKVYLLESIIKPFIRCHKIVLNPKKTLEGAYLTEDEVAQTVNRWVQKLTFFVANSIRNFPSFQMIDIERANREMIRTLCQTELQIEEIRSLLKVFYLSKRITVVGMVTRLNQGLSLDANTARDLQDICRIFLECFRYLGRTGYKFQRQDLEELKLLKKFCS